MGGIGAWEGILKGLTFLSVTTNVALSCFSMHPIRDRPMVEKLFIAMVVQNVMFVVVASVPFFMGTTSLEQTLIHECNFECADEIMGGGNGYKEVKVRKRAAPTAKIPI